MSITTTGLTELDRLDATAQAELVRSGELSVEEVVCHAIERIERLNPALNAVVTTAYDDALRRRPPAGPFHGVPYLLKDLGPEAAGMRHTAGSRFLRDHVSTADSELVRRLRAAGLVILGKTSTPEFGMSPTAETRLHGATANPWDTGRSCGGSSAGSAAAVAAGMVPMAHGSDAGGSIRIPASACGVFGLKPTRARVPTGPAYGDWFGGWVADHAVTRSVRDSAALLDVTAGPSAGDPYAAPAPAGPFLAEVGRPPGRLRIAWTAEPADGHQLDPLCRAALDDAVHLCADLGHELVERDLDELTGEVGDAIGTSYGAALTWSIRYWARELGREPEPDELEPFTRAMYERGRTISGGDYLFAVTTLQAFSRRIAAAFDDFDVWLSPTLAQLPPALGAMVGTDDDPYAGTPTAADLVAFPLVVANITGAPAMSVPLFWTDASESAPAGLPVGVHFLGRYGDEATLFRLAGQLEQARPWAHRHPA